MIKIKLLHELLELKEQELEQYTVDQLRLMLGVFRYLTRIIERKINASEEGNV
ncbi:MAG: hypothetical protein WCH62_03425 [Candidatus Omnitrophota bacterium]